jgi:hypothetical protein
MLDGGGWSVPCSSALYPHERDAVPIVQEAGWAPGLVWVGAGNLTLNPSTIQPVARRYIDCSVLAYQIHPSVSHM